MWYQFRLKSIKIIDLYYQKQNIMKKMIFTFSILIATLSQAQWTSDTNTNTIISHKNNGATFSIATTDGNTYVAFWKKVASPINFELRVQLVDKNGYKLFGEDGKLISDQIPMGTYTLSENIALDKDNNLYIGVTGSGSGTLAFVHKITTNGEMPWGAKGIELGEGYLPTIKPLANGEIMISYWPTSKTHARLQKYSSNGAPVWAEPTIVYSDDSSKKTVPAEIFELSNGNIQLVFHKITTGNYTNLFAQSFDTYGKTVWEKPVLLSTNTSTWSKKNTSFFEDDNVYYGFTSGMGGRSDSYLIKINPDGSLPWGVNGVDFSTNNAYFEKEIQIASEIGTNHIWGISTYNGAGSQNYIGEYVQKFDKKTGQRLFSDNGKEVFPLTLNNAKAHIGKLLLENDKPIFAFENRKQFNIQTFTTHITRLNSNGEFDFPEESLTLVTRESFRSHHSLIKVDKNQVLLTFNEDLDSSESSVLGQHITLPASNLSINQVNESELSIYPNPTTAIINFSKDLDNSLANVFDLSGKLMKTEKIKNKQLLVSDLPNAIYIIVIYHNGQKLKTKFIKK